MRAVTTDLNVLINEKEAPEIAQRLGENLRESGYYPSSVEVQLISMACEPDNMLMTQYEQINGRPPITEDLHRVVINGETDLDAKDATKAVVALLPQEALYYGTTFDGTVELGGAPACAWRP